MSQALSVPFAFGIVIFSFLCSLLIAGIFSALDPSILSGTNLGIFSYLALFFAQIFLVVPIVLFLYKKGHKLKDSFRFKMVSKRVLFFSMALSFGVVLISSELNIIIDSIFPLPDSFLKLDSLLSPDNPFSLILILLTVVIIAPIGEEMVFRGFLQRFLETTWKDITRAILVSSLFFTLIHFNPYWAIQIYLMGLILGYLSWLTKSIYPSILLHMSINGTSMLFIFLGEGAENSLLWKGHINPILFAVGVFAACYSLKYMHTKKRLVL
jgi:membrane protease YdiL (CAAX protease family)